MRNTESCGQQLALAGTLPVSGPRLVIRLKEAIQAYRRRTGEKLTYQILSDQTGVSLHTIQSMATRKGHVASLRNIERLCLFLECTPGEMLVIENQPVPELPISQ